MVEIGSQFSNNTLSSSTKIICKKLSFNIFLSPLYRIYNFTYRVPDTENI